MSALSLLAIISAFYISCGAPHAAAAPLDTAALPDDECATDGAADCGLNMLQVRGSKLSAVHEVSSEPCESNFIMRYIKSWAPDCFETCPQVCSGISRTLAKYMVTGGSIPTAMCIFEKDFSCMLSESAIDKCAPILHKVSAFGVTVPNTVESLTNVCGGVLEAPASGGQPLQKDADANSTNSTSVCGQNPLVHLITRFAPECFVKCPQLCKPIEGAIQYWMDNKEDASPLLCQYQEELMCTVEEGSKEACKLVLDRAADLGMKVERTPEGIRQQCAVQLGK